MQFYSRLSTIFDSPHMVLWSFPYYHASGNHESLSLQKHILQSMKFVYFSSIISQLQWFSFLCAPWITMKSVGDNTTFSFPSWDWQWPQWNLYPRIMTPSTPWLSCSSAMLFHADSQIKQTSEYRTKYATLWKTLSEKDCIWKRHWLKINKSSYHMNFKLVRKTQNILKQWPSTFIFFPIP